MWLALIIVNEPTGSFRRLWETRLYEKIGKFQEMPCHHMVEGYLA
jgi:hypothetical protein